ncbi:MAG TPA: zinc ribbon domain-containing protein [Thermoplasmata archaeon]|nr:zinc ribbon domain-containing protein [Thermoplasmata archaeon]
MTPSPEAIELSRCEACQARFLPTDGGCPRCGSTDVHPYSAPALGTVLVSTELTAPAEGWASPHRLALVEMPESVRLLAVVEGPLPGPGTVVSVRKDHDLYRAAAEPAG